MSAATTTARAGSRPSGYIAVAVATYAIFSVLTAYMLSAEGRPEAWLAVAAVAAAFAGRFRPAVVGVALVLGGAWLRFVMGMVGEIGADQLAVSQAALAVVLEGGNPYGIGYAETVPPGAPFVYGPLMLVWGVTGIWGEALASIGTLALLAVTRSWLTLALLATFPLFVIITTIGINDSTPGFFITAAMLALRSRPIVAGLLLAVAVGLKPYALAWLPALVSYGGLAAALAALAASLVAWSPVLVWGPQSVLRSVELARLVHVDSPAGGLNMPVLRVLALPAALAAFVFRGWTAAVLSGSAVFVSVLFFDSWASWGYWLAVLPITGIALEGAVRRWWAARAVAGAGAAAAASARPG